MQRIRWIIKQRTLTLLITIALLVLIIGIVTGKHFFTRGNINAVLVNAAFEAIVACGMTILLVGGLIDISVGAIMSLTSVLAAFAIVNLGWGILPSIILSLTVAITVGLINGIIIGKIGVNPLITTIATMGGVSGVAVLLAEGKGTIPVSNELYGRIGQTQFLGFTTPFWAMVIILILTYYLLSKNRFFRLYYYIGENSVAAELSGINLVKMKIIGFVISAFLAGVSGLLFSARLSAGVTRIGQGSEIRIITAVILGGASLYGGKGTITGSFLGIIFIALINNALVLGNVKVYWYSIINAVVLLAVVILDVIMTKEKIFYKVKESIK